MLKIGEFSKLSRVSVRMLRHYDEIGLLKPAERTGNLVTGHGAQADASGRSPKKAEKGRKHELQRYPQDYP